MRVALDRPYPSSLARRLRDLRHDVVALAERPELRDQGDEDLAMALAAEGRALVMQNAADWIPLQGLLPGLVLVDRHRYPRTPLSADRLILALDAALGGLAGDDRLPEGRRWLGPPAGCPFWPRAA
ncbi:MAG TPA: hypothetical protein VL422_13025 [Miltoncostaea sp.]|jgi:hypothetical protein|nr:hypothetical protein [Miltoncostaea sp.]